MSEDTSPFFIRPHRFDDPGPEDGVFPSLDGHHRIHLDAGEHVLWHGPLRVAEYLLGPATGAREPRWALHRPADVIVTDRRLAFVCADWEMETSHPTVRSIHSGAKHRFRANRTGTRLVTGGVRWQWPSRLRLLTVTPPAGGHPPGMPAPGTRTPGARPPREGGPPLGARPGRAWRGTNPTSDDQLLIVCDALRSTGQPGLGLTAGPLQPARTARDLAIVVRRAITRFRLANAHTIDLAPSEWDALRARAGSGAFVEELTDPGRGVLMPGALAVEFLDRGDYYRRSPSRSGNRSRTRRDTGPTGRSSSGQPESAS